MHGTIEELTVRLASEHVSEVYNAPPSDQGFLQTFLGRTIIVGSDASQEVASHVSEIRWTAVQVTIG